MILRKIGDCEQGHARIKLVSLLGERSVKSKNQLRGRLGSRRVLRKNITDTFLLLISRWCTGIVTESKKLRKWDFYNRWQKTLFNDQSNSMVKRRKALMFSVIQTPVSTTNRHFSVSRVTKPHISLTPPDGHWVSAHCLFSLRADCSHCTLFKNWKFSMS